LSKHISGRIFAYSFIITCVSVIIIIIIVIIIIIIYFKLQTGFNPVAVLLMQDNTQMHISYKIAHKGKNDHTKVHKL
jgi:hypothetical protein